MEGINRLEIHLDKKKVFGMIARSEYQIGRKNPPIIKWWVSKGKE